MLEKGDGYFYFRGGEAADWLDGTVPGNHAEQPDARTVAAGIPRSEDEKCRDSEGRQNGYPARPLIDHCRTIRSDVNIQ